MNAKTGNAKKLSRSKQILRNKTIMALQTDTLVHVRDLEVVYHVMELFLVLPFDLAVVIAPANKLKRLIAAYKKTKLNLLVDFIVHEQVDDYASKTQVPQIIVVDDYGKYKPPKQWKAVPILTTGKANTNAQCVI